MKKNILLVAVIVLFFSCNNAGKKGSGVGTLQDLVKNGPVTLDLTQKLPEREIVLQDVADVSYIPLETTDEVLLGRYRKIAAITDNLILAINQEGVVVFHADGTILSHFNKKGGSGQEYTGISQFYFDDKTKEIYIANNEQARIQVYDPEGKYIRTIAYPYRLSTAFFKKMNDKFLIFENNITIDTKRDTIFQPYMLLSEKDASCSRLDINITKPVVVVLKSERVTLRMFNEGNRHYGDGALLCDNSTDTIYYLSNKIELAPILTIQPSISQSEFYYEPKFICDNYLFLRTFSKKFIVENSKADMGEEYLLYDFATGELSPYKLINKDFPDNKVVYIEGTQTPKNTLTYFLEAGDILDAYEEDKLNGPLKDIAETLDHDDNPVLMLVKFHEN